MFDIYGVPARRGPLTFDQATSLMIPEDRERALSATRSALEGGGDRELPETEYRIVRPGGDQRVLFGRARVIFSDSGRPLRVVGTVQDVTSRKQVEDALALQERHRLARDLHDSVSQALFSMTLHARAAQLAFDREISDPSSTLGHHLEELRELTQAAMAEMKALIFELRPEALREEGLVVALRKHGAALAARDELMVEVESPGDRIAIPPPIEEQIYRLAQEALTNIAKHAQAKQVRIRISAPETDSGELKLTISDDGVGFDPSLDRPGHLGLKTMAQRIQRLSGKLDVMSSQGMGTTVRATVPFQRDVQAGHERVAGMRSRIGGPEAR
jgi:signal transduction histidine kinase